MKQDLEAISLRDAARARLKAIAEFVNGYAGDTDLGRDILFEPQDALAEIADAKNEVYDAFLEIETDIAAFASARSEPKLHDPDLSRAKRSGCPVPQSDRTGA